MNVGGVASTAVQARGGAGLPPVYVALGLVALAATLFLPELRELGVRWSESEADSHGWLVAVLVPVLVWLQRDRVEAGGGFRGLAVLGLLGSATVYAVARAASIDVVAWFAMPFTVFFALWIAFGARGAFALAFPVGYFLFAVPFWGLLTPVFQWMTVVATTLLLSTVGVGAYIEGDLVTVPAGTFEIAGGCAGMNFVVVALAISTLLAFVGRLSWRGSLSLVAVGLVVAVVANWIRVTIIIWAGNATAMQTSLVEDHYTFGWWVFAATMVPYFWFARRVAQRDPPPPSPARVPAMPLGAPVLAGAAAMALAPGWGYAVAHAGSMTAPEISPPRAEGWHGPAAAASDWRPAYPGAADERFAAFDRDGMALEAYAAVYDRQSPGRKLIGEHSTNAPDGWVELSREIRELPASEGAVLEQVLDHGLLGSRVAWSWYEVRGERLLSGVQVKLREGLQAFGWPRRSGVVVLSSRCVPDCDVARRVLATAYEAGLGNWTTSAP